MKTTPQLRPESLVARIITELQENPDAQTLLLRALLTGEFLGMPTRLARVEADVAVLKEDVAVLKNDVGVLKNDVAVLKEDVAVLKEDVAVLKNDVGVLKNDVAMLKGDSLEVKMQRRIRSLLGQRLELRKMRVMQSPVLDTAEGFADPVLEAYRTGVITSAQESRIHATDLVFRALPKEGASPLWLAVEASNAIGRRDIERVRQTADALHTVFKENVLGVVAGYRIHPRDQEQADEAGVYVLLVKEANA